MNTITIKHFGIIALGGIAGGIAGYFLATLILDQLLKIQEEFEEEENIIPEIKVGKLETVKIRNKRDYTQYAEKGSLEELVRPYTKPEVKSKQDNIKIISVQEYEGDRTLNREPIAYYAGDTTFCNANEEIIPNPEDFFGPNVHLHFGEESDDPDIVYVKNENNGVSYEITQVHGKYSVVVLGMADEEPKVTKAKQRRRSVKKAEPDESEESIENEGEE